MHKLLRNGWLAASLALGLLGVGLLAVKAVTTYGIAWVAAETPLPVEPGGRARVSFVATVPGAYEVVLEYRSVISEAKLGAMLTKTGADAATDVAWTATRDGTPIAAGSSDRLIYKSTGGRTWLGRARRWLLSIPQHRDHGSFIQVIGRIRAVPGTRYDVEAETRRLDPALLGTSPSLAVRPGREAWQAHDDATRPLAYGGLAAIVLSVGIGAVGLAVMLGRKFRRNASG